jgi:hypothetical protein
MALNGALGLERQLLLAKEERRRCYRRFNEEHYEFHHQKFD